MEVIQKTVIDDINPQIFSNILLNLEFIENSLDSKKFVFATMLRQPKYIRDPEIWLKYIYFLGTNGQITQAKQEYERSLILLDTVEKKTQMTREYAKIKF